MEPHVELECYREIKSFLRFLLKKVYRGEEFVCPDSLIKEAFERSFADFQYYLKDASQRDLITCIEGNGNELGVFLFRLGAAIYRHDPKARGLLDATHWLMKECCACEIYYSNQIDVGFSIIHGIGTVVGSRNRIGKGFKIHHGCTVGHRFHGEAGCVVGDNVLMYPNSQIIGQVSIGNNCIIGNNCMIIDDVPDSSKCYGPTIAKIV